MELLRKARFYWTALSFPTDCARCGSGEAPRRTLLLLPHQAWFGPTPQLKVPVCRMCFLWLAGVEWISLLVLLAVSLAGLTYLSRWFVVGLIFAHHRFFHVSAPWMSSEWFATCVVMILFVCLFFPLADLRRKFLRATSELKIEVVAFHGDWVEIGSSDPIYFEEMVRVSPSAIAE
jgi:hypothetical protein